MYMYRCVHVYMHLLTQVQATFYEQMPTRLLGFGAGPGFRRASELGASEEPSPVLSVIGARCMYVHKYACIYVYEERKHTFLRGPGPAATARRDSLFFLPFILLVLRLFLFNT